MDFLSAFYLAGNLALRNGSVPAKGDAHPLLGSESQQEKGTKDPDRNSVWWSQILGDLPIVGGSKSYKLRYSQW